MNNPHLHRSGDEGPDESNDGQEYVDPVIEAYKKDVDRTIIRHNLRLSVQERFENLMQMQRFAEEMRAAMLRATGGR
jgi:hypothetical protein